MQYLLHSEQESNMQYGVGYTSPQPSFRTLQTPGAPKKRNRYTDGGLDADTHRTVRRNLFQKQSSEGAS